LYFRIGSITKWLYTSKPSRTETRSAALLGETCSQNGKIHKHTVGNLSDWSPRTSKGLRGMLKRGIGIPAG
jgi:hypothetical protein